MQYVLVHGLGLSADIWSRLTPLLNGKVIAVDLPGHGKSQSKDYDWNSMWMTISDPIKPVEWRDTVLVLHSFTATLLPEIISSGVSPEKIILLEGILHPDDAYWSNDLALLDDIQFNSWLVRFRSVSEMALKSQLITKHEKNSIQRWSNAFRVVDGEAIRSMAINLRNRLVSGCIPDALSSLENKIIYVRGGKSRLSSVGLALIKSHLVPVVEVSNSGHFPMIDNPIKLAGYILH